MGSEVPERFNIADHFLTARLEAGDADRVALRLDDRDVTYAQVHALSQTFAARLTELDVRVEERVVIALPDGAAYVGALFGIVTVGAVVVMVNPDLPADALTAILHQSRARVLITDESGRTDEAVAAARTVQHVLTVDPAVGPSTNREAVATAATHRDDAAIWLFSGGTTGAPKAVPQTHRSFANTTERYGKGVLGMRPDDITIAVPKLYFGYATGSSLLFPFSVGASTVLFADRATPEALFERIAHHRATILVTVPKMVSAMLDHDEPGDLSSLRLATSAGEALPAKLYQRWVDRFGVELLDGLGTAEMWHIFLSNRPDDVRPGTLGRAVDGFEVRVRDEDGADLAHDQAGLLWVRGDSRALGYWHDADETARTFRGEWVVTGDLISQDADGYVTYVGRGDDALKVGGKWVIPSEVEGCLLEHDAVREAAVIGVPNDAGLTEPVAFVLIGDVGTSYGIEGELRQHVLDRLEPHKHPRKVVVLDDFPRTHLGKVDRGALRRSGT